MNRNEGEPKFIYHYMAECKGICGIKFTIDGIARMVEKIETMDDYRDFKKLVLKDEDDKETQVTITSLSLISEI